VDNRLVRGVWSATSPFSGGYTVERVLALTYAGRLNALADTLKESCH